MATRENEKSVLRLLPGYLWGRRRTLLGFLVFLLMQATVYWLYHVPAEPVIYTIVLTVVAGLVFGAADFTRCARHLRTLSAMVQPVPVDDRHLPDARDPVDASYQTLVRRLREETARITGERDHRLAEMNDYYTLWAHQIKTPIAAMRLLLADDRTDPGALRQELFKIEQYAEMVLHYLRLESLSADLVLREHDVWVIARDTVRKHAPVFIGSGVSLLFDRFSMPVLTDAKWLGFALGQVLSNALKYTPRGSVTLRPDPADARALLIEDTGIGIRPEDIPRIFDRGFTGVNGRSELGQKSTGIGLYLARQVLTRLSHTISATSEVGRGTCIRIGFPDLAES